MRTRHQASFRLCRAAPRHLAAPMARMTPLGSFSTPPITASYRLIHPSAFRSGGTSADARDRAGRPGLSALAAAPRSEPHPSPAGVGIMTRHFDAIVIGSGQAGPSLAVRLAQSGLATALVEREHLGGTCVNDGCIPTKTLVASARAAHVVRRAADYGLRVAGATTVDMQAVKT